MGDSYWRYGDGRQPAMLPPSGKRPRSDYDIPGGHELAGYYSRDDERVGHHMIRDTESIGASYDRYLRNGQISSFGGGEPGRSLSGGMTGHPGDDPRMVSIRDDPRMVSIRDDPRMVSMRDDPRMVSIRDDPRMVSIGSMDLGMAAKGQSMGFGGGKPEIPLPPDASNTLFVEGLPANCTRREVSHIFRPFVGFKEVRLVSKESRIPGGDPLVLCFVDFGTPSQAAVSLDALQGYKFDDHDRDSSDLRIQFARYPGPRSGGGSRGSGGGSRGSRGRR